jgi:transposase
MGFAIPFQRADPSAVRATARLEAVHLAVVDLWRKAEAKAHHRRIPRNHGPTAMAGWCMGCGSDLAQWYDGAFERWSRDHLDRSLVESGAARMLSLSPATRIFVALEPVDLRQSFNGLSARVQSVLAQDPCSGHLFLFTNRHHNRIKVLFFDGSGLWVCAKRLEKGTFGWPQGNGPSSCLRPEELTLLLNGLEATPRRNWFRR